MTRKDPDRTREILLERAFQEMYMYGFQAASLDRILKDAGVTKGALYHHFGSKIELGYAVIDEVVMDWFKTRWLDPLEQIGDPIDGIRQIMRNMATDAPPEAKHFGCPLNNLAQEMSPIDPGFQKRIVRIFEMWRNGIAEAFRAGQQQKRVRTDVDPHDIATFIIATFEGGISFAKANQSLDVLVDYARGLDLYLDSLRPPKRRKAA